MPIGLLRGARGVRCLYEFDRPLSRSSIPRKLREAVFERDVGRCRDFDNLAIQCPDCSLHNADKPGTRNAVAPFHPLQKNHRDRSA
jgi:hypothetical protein